MRAASGCNTATLRGRFCGECSANAKIAAADQTKHIRKRTFFPGHLQVRRL